MLAASLVALIGTAILYTVGVLLFGLVGTAWDLSFCALGAFLTTRLVNRQTRTTFPGNLGAATIIVFGTFVFISLGHAASQILERHVAIDFEPVGKLIWATVATSWWLIPLCALILARLNRIGSGPVANDSSRTA